MPLLKLHNLRLMRGYLYGMRSAALSMTLEGPLEPEKRFAARTDLLIDCLRELSGSSNCVPTQSSEPDRILQVFAHVHRAVSFPIRDAGVIVTRQSTQDKRMWRLLVPVLPTCADVASRILNWLLDDADDWDAKAIEPFLGELASNVPGGPTGLHFMNAAIDKGIPVNWLGGHVVQYGTGARARLLDGSFTDATSRIGSVIARNKLLASSVLSEHGIPVPLSQGVRTADQAVTAAEKIGYPVVVKPADLDGGVSVHCRLQNAEGVRKAAEACLTRSTNVMVEKWVTGRDYRLVVLNGQLIFAIERIPGGVTGDGKSQISTLIEQYNADPRRGPSPLLPFEVLEIDAEANELLLEQGMTLQSIPSEGHFVRLRQAANIARGGLARAAFDEVHPDNRLLAERAADALRLDLAGIDLLIPDISRSWHETGAAICEVNAQPVLGSATSAHLYPQILATLVKGNGRIPVIAVIGDDADCTVANAIAKSIEKLGVKAGLSSATGVAINGTPLNTSISDTFGGAQMLLRDGEVSAAVICIGDTSILETGMPFDAFDCIVVAGDKINGGNPAQGDLRLPLLESLVRSCQRAIYIAPQCSELDHGKISSIQPKLRIDFPSSLDALVNDLVSDITI